KHAAVVPGDVMPTAALPERLGQQVAGEARQQRHGDQCDHKRAAATAAVILGRSLLRLGLPVVLSNHPELLPRHQAVLPVSAGYGPAFSRRCREGKGLKSRGLDAGPWVERPMGNATILGCARRDWARAAASPPGYRPTSRPRPICRTPPR